jgi:arsenate reductase
MAEGWARALKGDVLEPYSAGVDTKPLDRRAVEAMAEKGIDISGQRSKHVSELLHVDFDYVVTVCDNARDTCPSFPGRAKIVHREFDDPPYLARNAESEAQALAHYRRVRDEIRSFVESLPRSLVDQESR